MQLVKPFVSSYNSKEAVIQQAVDKFVQTMGD